MTIVVGAYVPLLQADQGNLVICMVLQKNDGSSGKIMNLT